VAVRFRVFVEDHFTPKLLRIVKKWGVLRSYYMRRLAFDMLVEAVRATPVGVYTPHPLSRYAKRGRPPPRLRAGWRIRPVGRFDWIVFNVARHALVVERGRRKRVLIRPRRARALAFVYRGIPMVKDRVSVGAFTGRRYLAKAMRRVRALWRARFRNILVRLVRA